MGIVVREITCKSALIKTKIPGHDYALNPYVGCLHACRYCYADFMRRFTGHHEPWGKFLDIKLNAPHLLEKELKTKKPGIILIGTVTDPYQPVELKYRITRKCLIKLLDSTMSVSILTKSANVLYDKDILTKFKNIEVGFTITLLDESIKKLFEPMSSTVQARLHACSELAKAGITTWIFFAPVLPYFSDNETHIRNLLELTKKAGAKYLLVDVLNPYPTVRHRVTNLLKKNFNPDILKAYLHYYEDRFTYCKDLQDKIAKLNQEFKLPVRYTF